MEELRIIKDRLLSELKECAEKEMSSGTLDVVDKLTHSIKNLDKVMEGLEGRSYGRGMNRYSRGYSYNDDYRPDMRW